MHDPLLRSGVERQPRSCYEPHRTGGGFTMARAKAIAARQFTYTAVFDPVVEGRYVVSFPALPGLVTEGETLEDARRMAEDALRCYLEGHLEDGLPIPLEEEASPAAVRQAISVTLQAE
jgi:predicted RNase H-like HicB family nuclease